MQISVERYIHTYLHIYYSINILLRFYSKYAIASLNTLACSILQVNMDINQ